MRRLLLFLIASNLGIGCVMLAFTEEPSHACNAMDPESVMILAGFASVVASLLFYVLLDRRFKAKRRKIDIPPRPENH